MKTHEADDDEGAPSPVARGHSARIRRRVGELINHLTADVDRVIDPNFRALLEVSAAVLKGVRTAYAHYDAACGKSRPRSK